jgi:Asp-tRNA(Asn)/Glu-tRNA(Gln) amidotransferase A subunit family amidase
MKTSYGDPQAQRARTKLAQQVLQQMDELGVSALIGNTTQELAMSNLVGLPTLAVPTGFDILEDAPNSTRRRPLSVGIFARPFDEPLVRLSISIAQPTTRSPAS